MVSVSKQGYDLISKHKLCVCVSLLSMIVMFIFLFLIYFFKSLYKYHSVGGEVTV